MLRIGITQGDIDSGVPGSRTRCPLGRALAREFPAAIYIGALPGVAAVHFGDSTVNVYEHDSARFSWQFDPRDRAEPGEVELTLVKVVDHKVAGFPGASQ